MKSSSTAGAVSCTNAGVRFVSTPKRGNDLFDLLRAVAQMPIAEIKTSAWKEANRERWKLFERQA
jgi:hypothetical protein